MTTQSHNRRSGPTLITSGTGKTGRRVANRLHSRGLPVRIGSRSGAPPFDWESPATWVPALRGVQSVYIVYYPDLAVSGALSTIESFVDADDIADVAVVALTEDGHAGQLYEVTGPRSLTFAQAVEEIATAAGRDIRYEQVPLEAYVASLARFGVPAEVVELLTYPFSTVLDGRNAEVADGVERALGRPSRDFADFAREIAAAGVWDNGASRSSA